MKKINSRLLNFSASLFRVPVLAGMALFASIAASDANVWPIEDQWLPLGLTLLSDMNGSYDNGDGADGETMLLVDGTTSSGPQGVTYDFRGVLTSGEDLSVNVRLVNPNAVECRLMIDFYNATDSRVISTSPEIVLAPNSTQSVTLSMTATAADASNALKLRLIRSDDGATTRDFAIDSVSINGYYFPRTSNNSKTPDLPLLANDEALQTDMNSIKNSWYAANLPNPTASQATLALNDYNARGITNINGVLTGNITAFGQTAYLKILAGALYHDDPTNTQWLDAVNNTVKLVAQNKLRGTLNTGDFYNWDSFTRPAILLADFLDQAAKDSLTYVLNNQLDSLWIANYPGPDSVEDLPTDAISTDQIYVLCDTFMIYGIAMQRNNQEAQRWARGFKRYCERFATPSRGTSNGIKRDGSGFHHWCNYENYMHAYNTFIDVLDALGTTQVQIEDSYYLNFRDAIVAQFARARSDVRPFSLCGRHPNSLGVDVTQSSLKKLALAGGRILGLATADPEVAKVYNYLYQTNAFPGVSGSNPMEGAFQFSYGHLGAYRQNNWTAAMHGFSIYMWGTEIYGNSNRYGRYQSYGSLQIIYEGTQASNGINLNGWDWNHQPGTTTIALPFAKLNGERERIDERQSKRFAGFGTLGNKGSALLNRVHGTYGVFGMDFQEMEGQGFDAVLGPNTHNNTFVFRKSVFTFDGLLIAMGSNIANDDSTNHTVTTLFQHTAGGTNVVNGTSYTSVGRNTFTANSMRWVLDRMGTGYYVPSANNDLILTRETQSTPPHDLIDPLDTASYQSGVFSKLYLDHGMAPSGGAYEYVAIPGTTATAMADFAQSMEAAAGLRPYQVMAKNGNQHVVKYQGNGKEVWGLCLFSNVASLHSECIVRANTGASLVMYEKHSPSSITLSVTDPNLENMSSRSNRPALETVVVLKLAGEWMAASVNTNITLAFANGQTTLTVNLKDGLPQEIALQSGYLGWLAAYPSISGSTPETDFDGDGVANLMEYALGGNPIIRDATTVLPQVQATPSGAQFMFHRPDASEIDTIMTFQYSDDLGTQTAWTDVAIGAASSGPDPNGVGVTVEENGSDLDLIRITIPVGFKERLFGRIRVSLTP